MTPNPSNPGRLRGRAPRRALAALVTVGVASTAIVAAGAGSASAAPAPQAQSVGNFVDATLGSNPIDAIAKLKYARAVAPGSNGVQNPLDVTALNAINLPLTGALQLPQIAGIKLGAANQVAKANVNGSSYGASGAVSNSGGVSVGGDNNALPAAATIDLNAASLAGNSPIPLPNEGPSLAALGGVKATIGAVAAKASTPKGYGKAGSTEYGIADVQLEIGSPLLGQTLGTVLGQVTTAASGALGALGNIVAGLTGCTITAPKVNPLSLAGGAVTIDSKTATITVHLAALLKVLGLDLNNLPANTDLIDYLLAYIADPNGLAKGLTSLVNSIIDPLQTQFSDCLAVVGSNSLTDLLKTLSTQLKQGQSTLEGLVGNVVTQLTAAAGVNPLAPLATALRNLIDIGVNVQPNGKAGTYTDPLAATPKQGTAVVDGQTVVRAIEVNVAGAAGSQLSNGIPSLGSLGSLSSLGGSKFMDAAPLAAAAPSGQGILTLALANAAAGPSTAAVAPPSTSAPAPTPTTSAPNTNVPTGIPAGAAAHDGGSPVLPLVVLLLALSLAGGGYVSYRMRGKYTP